MKRLLYFAGALMLVAGCQVKKVKERTYAPTFQAKAVGVSGAIQKGAALLKASHERRITVHFRPKVKGAYTVAVLPNDDRFVVTDLIRAGIPEQVVFEMERVLFRFGTAPKSTICFHREARKRKVTTTTSHSRYVVVPALLTVIKQGGTLAITLEKGEAGLIHLVALE